MLMSRSVLCVALAVGGLTFYVPSPEEHVCHPMDVLNLV